MGQIWGSSGGPERSNEATVGPWWDYGVAVGQIWGSSEGLEEVCGASVRQWGLLWGRSGAEEALGVYGTSAERVMGQWWGCGVAVKAAVGQRWGLEGLERICGTAVGLRGPCGVCGAAVVQGRPLWGSVVTAGLRRRLQPQHLHAARGRCPHRKKGRRAGGGARGSSRGDDVTRRAGTWQ